MTSSDCTTIWGDGILTKPRERCDDGSKDNNKGWKQDCSDSLSGWYCSDPAPPNTASTCVTNNTDGIRIEDEEIWDDGNSDSGDGWSSSFEIEDKWECTDDDSHKSVWNLLCGNGKKDHSDEQWDDGNLEGEDGCDDNWIIEEGWKWFEGIWKDWFRPLLSFYDKYFLIIILTLLKSLLITLGNTCNIHFYRRRNKYLKWNQKWWN